MIIPTLRQLAMLDLKVLLMSFIPVTRPFITVPRHFENNLHSRFGCTIFPQVTRDKVFAPSIFLGMFLDCFEGWDELTFDNLREMIKDVGEASSGTIAT